MQNILMYPGAITELVILLHKLNAKKVFLVTGKKSFDNCGAKEAVSSIFDVFSIVHFSDFSPNPSSSDAEKGIRLFRDCNCDLIVSIGGGSAIDIAKLINYYHTKNNLPITVDNINNDNFTHVPHISIPTTAGSGSESTHFAVMYLGDEKFSIADQKLLPEHVIIDSNLHHSQTPYQKAVSGADALAQAIESFWSVNSTDESMIYSKKALLLLWEFLPQVVHKSDNYAHFMVAVGANLAGRAINISKTTAAHALSYGFTNHFGLPHGHAVSLSLPYFLEQHSLITEDNCNDKRGVTHVKGIINQLSKIIIQNNGNLKNNLIEFYRNIGIDTDLSAYSSDKNKINKIIEEVNQERLQNNPIKINTTDLKKYFIKNIRKNE